MGASIDETVVINRKPRAADQGSLAGLSARESKETVGILRLTIRWSGPFSRNLVLSRFNDEGPAPDFDGKDYGLYQIYGTHILSGKDALLYIGQATRQTFSRRFRQHEEWLVHEQDVAVYVGRIYDRRRHTEQDLWKSWESEVQLAERLLIYKYSPHYNAGCISEPPILGNFQSVELSHVGNHHKLHSRDSAPDDWE